MFQRCRLLQYSHDSRSLFYTDALHNSVQSYSLSDKRVADAAKPHPSPVSAFAVSCDSNLILSASEHPPTIQIHNQLMITTISIAPSASAAAVVSCAFHPSRKQIFVLVFADGVVAAFDYNNLSKGKQVQENPYGVIRRHAKAIHAFKHLHDPSIAGSSGITGVQFIPGYRGRAITVGEDGRCFLVDFEQGVTVASWHIGAPATSVTLRQVASGQSNDLGGYLVAIGTVHGRCVIYDGNANRIGDRRIDPDGDAVLDVEWVHGEVNLPEGGLSSPVASPTSPDIMPMKSKDGTRFRKSKPRESLYSQGTNPHIAPQSPLEGTGGNLDEESPTQSRSTMRDFNGLDAPASDPLDELADQSYMNLFSPVKKRVTKPASLPEHKVDKEPHDPHIDRGVGRSKTNRSAISAPQLWDDRPSEPDLPEEPEPQSEPEPPSPRPTRKSSPVPPSSPHHPIPSFLPPKIKTVTCAQPIQTDSSILSEIRSIRTKAENSRTTRTGNLAFIAPYLPSRVRTTPASRASVNSSFDSARHRASDPPNPRLSPKKTALEAECSESVEPSSEPITQEGYSEYDTSTFTAQPDDGHQTSENPLSPLEADDIWLADTASRGRKRKKQSVRVGEDGESAMHKSRKTVSFAVEGVVGVAEVLRVLEGVREEMRKGFEELGVEVRGLRGEVQELRRENGELRRELERE